MSNNYVAYCKCGNIVGIASGDPEGSYTKKEIAKEISSWIRNDLEIGSMETEEVRKLKYMKPGGFGCICQKQIQKALAI